MKGWLSVVVGAVLVAVGVVWALQGAGKIGGSVMSGKSIWEVIGPIVAVVGLVLFATGVRWLRTARSPH